MLVQDVRSKENEKNLATQKLHYLKEKETGLKNFLSKADGKVNDVTESIQFSELQIREEETKLQEMQQSLDAVKKEAEEKRNFFEEKRTTVDRLGSSYQKIQWLHFEAEKKVAVADTSIQNLQRAQIQFSDERENREGQIHQLENELKEKKILLENKRTDLQQLQEHHERTKEQILETQQQLEALRAKLAEETRKLDARCNEHELLKSLIDSMEGYPESVKFLHKNPNWNNAAPILSDIIYVNEEYRAAVENVLEPYLNYYVVENLEEGLQAVHLLDDNKKGKANFFLLDQLNEAAVLGAAAPFNTIPALDVIEVDEKYRSLANYLLANVFIAENE